MKTTSIVLLVLLLFTLSCQKKESIQPKNDVELLYQRFHGKYKIISATSSEPVDVNFDGVSSRNLLQEIGELNNYGNFLEIRVKNVDKAVFLLTQFWSEQYVHTYRGSNPDWNGADTLSYNQTYSVNYNQQGSGYRFSFADDLSQILVTPDEKSHPVRWVKPELVLIEAEDQIRVTNKRRLYTKQGVKEVIITTVYERFTRET